MSIETITSASMRTQHQDSGHWLWTLLFVSLFKARLASPQFISAISPCPIQCDATGFDPSAWTYYHDFSQLDACDGTVLFQTNIYNNITDGRNFYYRACTASGGTVLADGTTGVKAQNDSSRIQTQRRDAHEPHLHSRQALSLNGTAPSPASLQLASWAGAGNIDISAAQSAIDELATYASKSNESVIFARSASVVAGTYVGSQIDRSSAASVISKFRDQASQKSYSGLAAQTCGASNRTIGPQYFGVVYRGSLNVAAVKEALLSWNEAQCVEGDESRPWNDVEVDRVSGKDIPITPTPQDKTNSRRRSASLRRRDTCKYTQVQSGDGCYALAQRCGISQSDLESYNGGSNFCNTLKPDQYVCCSPGDPPDFSPQPNSDGSCYAYTVVANDYCASIAEAHQMSVQDIEDRNPKTWGWTGCANLFLGMKICLSTGVPPFPANVPNAVCGPQVNDTQPNSDPSSWAGLNPCPLNACCDIFGQCGITSDFCTADPADTGNPGTAQPGSNGCISNCGTDIISGSPVSNFERVGYYEAFNVERPCDHLAVSAIPDQYTIVHWAFASISDSYQPSISPYEDAWATFKAAKGYKKIVSFGGWTFSTAPSSYNILRSGVKPENRQPFANNIASFVKSEGLDGVDIDWEYPGAPDDQGENIPIDSPDSGPNYLAFLKLLRAALPSGTTLSIAIPSSYYYLKAFPAKDMSATLDYFIYMAYDLHGQWDYGNKFTNPGCPMGNCLRSQINQTETDSALSMITKAGVPASKIMLGQPLYGRSFQMSQAGCTGPECTFTGPSSGARAGNCTNTPGYLSNEEIRAIIDSGSNIQQFMADKASDILVYDNDNWVSWMKPSTYDTRSQWVQSLGFAGTSDWAIDLNITGGSDSGGGNGSGGGGGGGNGGGSGVVTIDPSIYSDPDPTVTCMPPCTFVLPPWTLPYTTTITPTPVTETITEQWPFVSTLSGMVTTTVYLSKTTATTITFPPITTTEIPVWNVNWTDTDDSTLALTSSIILPPVTLSQESTVVTTSGSTTTIAGIYWTYSLGPYPPISHPDPTQGPTPTIGPPPPPSSCSHCPPIVTPKPGPPGPDCVSGCGMECEHNCDPDDEGGNDNDNDCIGIGCPHDTDCIGLGCDDGGGGGGGGGGNPNDPDEPTSCSESTTVTDCSVDCNVGPESGTLSTSCYSTTCSQHVGCETTGSTTTSESTTACPIEMPYTVTYGPDGQLPLLGGGGDDGEIIYAGLIGPNPVSYDPGYTTSTSTKSSPPTTSSSPSPDPSPTVTFTLYTDNTCDTILTNVTLDSLNTCNVPQPNTGWLSMFITSRQGFTSDTEFVVYAENDCNHQGYGNFGFLGDHTDCINQFGMDLTSDACDRHDCFVATALEWIQN